jgi:hypothetical protein
MVYQLKPRRLHFVGGRKGGTGKSSFARAFAEYLFRLGQEFSLAECDRVNPDVARFYRNLIPTLFAYFSEDERKRSKADALYAQVLQSIVIANLPAQVHEAMKAWFMEDALFELAETDGVTFCHWYVSNGGYDSVKLFIKTLQDLGEWMPHVFVKNWGLCDDWTHVDNDTEFQQIIAAYTVPVINLPKLTYFERNFIEANQLTFLDAEAHKDLSAVSRQRIKNFLRQSFAEIERTGMV